MATQMSVRQMLENAGVHFDSFGKNKAGNYVIRRGFFYTHGYTSDQYAAALKEKLPQANVIDHGEVWKDFRGGASVGKQSHWYVEFRIRTDQDVYTHFFEMKNGNGPVIGSTWFSPGMDKAVTFDGKEWK